MSDLPPSWEWATLGELGDWYGGGTPSKSNPEYWSNGTIPWLSPKDMGPEILTKTRDKISPSALENSAVRLVPPNSVAIVVRSGILERTLPVSVVPFATTLNQDMRAVVPFSGISPSWIAYFIRSTEAQLLRECSKRGTTVASIDVSNLMKVPVPVPPESEQHRIVATLEDHLSRLDGGKRSLSDATEKTQLLERVLLDHIVLGRSDEAGGDDCFGELATFQPKKIDYKRLPRLPRLWKWRVAADICSSIECGGTPKSHLMYPDEGDVPFLKVYNLTRRGVVDFSVRPTFIDNTTHKGTLRRSKVIPGDVLTNIVGPPLGKTVVVPDLWPEWNINQAIVAFRAGPEVEPGWLAIALRSPFILGLLQKTARATAGQFNISLSTCRELPIPIPPTAEQSRLIETVKEQLRGIERMSLDIEVSGRRNTALRRSLLAEAYAGRLVPQESTDEPASILLERIRVERVTQPKTRRARKTKNTIQETLL